MVYKDKAWCQIEDTYSDNVCLMCPSTGHKSIFNSHDVAPVQSLFWRKLQEMTLTAGVISHKVASDDRVRIF